MMFESDLKDPDNDSHADSDGSLDIRRFGSSFRFRDYAYTPRIKQAAMLEGFDIVHADGYRNHQTDVAAWLARKTNRPMLLTAHGTTVAFMGSGDRLIKWMYDIATRKRAIQTASAVIAVSHREVEELVTFGVPSDKIHRIPLGVDTGFFKPEPRNSDFSRRFNLDDRLVLLYVGRIHPIKGLETLIKCFSVISRNHPSTLLLLAGPENEYSRNLQALAQRLGVARDVIFTGRLVGEDLKNAYNTCVCLILPSKYEVFGLALLEAGACAKPCVAAATGGAEEIIVDGRTGFVMRDGNPLRALPRAVATLLDNEDLRSSMGQSAREHVVNNFSWKKCALAHEALYGKLLTAGSQHAENLAA